MDPRLERIQEIYDSMPEIACKGLCANSCGPIDMSEAERERIVDLGVVIPRFTGEAARRWANDEPLHCPALNRQTLKCDVYEARPFICRAWGVSASMPCPHGCTLTRELSDVETYQLMFATFQAGGHLHYSQPEMEQFLILLEDEEVGPLMAKFIRGDRSVEGAIVAALERKRCKTNPSASSARNGSTETSSTKPPAGTTDAPAPSSTPSA